MEAFATSWGVLLAITARSRSLLYIGTVLADSPGGDRERVAADADAQNPLGRRSRILLVYTVFPALASCGIFASAQPGRWARYASGGSFIGARPSVSPDGKLVVYASPSAGHGDIYLLSLDGKTRNRLTSDPQLRGRPGVVAGWKK